MPVAAQGPLSLSLTFSREIIAACAAFISRTGAANAAEAAEFIFRHDRPSTDETSRSTWATVFRYAGITDYERTRLGSEKGSTAVSFFSLQPTELTDPEDALTDFENFVGEMVNQIRALAKTTVPGGDHCYQGVHNVREILPAGWCEQRDDDSEDPPEMMATLLLEWV
jgi:hypothetical protein